MGCQEPIFSFIKLFSALLRNPCLIFPNVSSPVHYAFSVRGSIRTLGENADCASCPSEKHAAFEEEWRTWKTSKGLVMNLSIIASSRRSLFLVRCCLRLSLGKFALWDIFFPFQKFLGPIHTGHLHEVRHCSRPGLAICMCVGRVRVRE